MNAQMLLDRLLELKEIRNLKEIPIMTGNLVVQDVKDMVYGEVIGLEGEYYALIIRPLDAIE